VLKSVNQPLGRMEIRPISSTNAMLSSPIPDFTVIASAA